MVIAAGTTSNPKSRRRFLRSGLRGFRASNNTRRAAHPHSSNSYLLTSDSSLSYDHKRLLCETDAVSGAISQTYASDTTEEFGDLIGEDGQYIHQYDAQANTNALLDDTGTVQAQYKYFAFGQVSAVSIDGGAWTAEDWQSLPLGFTSNMLAGGKKQYYLDQEIALYLLGSGNNGRYYDANTGRFLSEDPTKEAGGDDNLFRYTGNDPINNLDPSGHDTQPPQPPPKQAYHPSQKPSAVNPNPAVPVSTHVDVTTSSPQTAGSHAGTAGHQKSPNVSSPIGASSQGNNLAWIAALQGRPTDTSVAGMISPSQSSAGGGEVGKYLESGTAALIQHPSALGPGSLQGLANTLNTVENAVDSVVNSAVAGNNLLNMGANKIAGLVDHGAAPFGRVPSVPTSNWSKGAIVSHDPARPVEKAITGTAIAVATTFGGEAAEDTAPALVAASDAAKGLMGKVSAIAEKVGGWIKGLFGKTEEEGVQANKLAGDAVRDAIAAREAPAQIEQTFNTVGGTRRVDVLKTGIRSTAIESKVGRTFLDARVRQELARDWWLRRQGQVGGVRWEFSRSKVTGELGPAATLLQKLQKLGFDVRINQ